MKRLIKVILAGIEIICMSVSSLFCFLVEIPLYKSFVEANGFAAVGLFISMILFFIIGSLLLWSIGIIGTQGKIKKK